VRKRPKDAPACSYYLWAVWPPSRRSSIAARCWRPLWSCCSAAGTGGPHPSFAVPPTPLRRPPRAAPPSKTSNRSMTSRTVRPHARGNHEPTKGQGRACGHRSLDARHGETCDPNHAEWTTGIGASVQGKPANDSFTVGSYACRTNYSRAGRYFGSSTCRPAAWNRVGVRSDDEPTQLRSSRRWQLDRYPTSLATPFAGGWSAHPS